MSTQARLDDPDNVFALNQNIPPSVGPVSAD
jgi:hypothetical protein